MAGASLPGESSGDDPVAGFRRIVRETLRIAGATSGVEAIEPQLEAALALLKDNLSLRKEFEGELISLLDPPLEQGTVELVSFVMHELRWDAVRADVSGRLVVPTGNVSNLRLYEAVQDSFSDSWRDRDLFSRFG